MIKKIVHLSDLHIRTLKYIDMYERQFDKMIDELTINLEGYQIEEIRIVITGDVVHQKINVSNEMFIIMAKFFSSLAKIGKLIIIPGNHDFLENNHERIDSISPIVNVLREYDIEYYKDAGLYEDENVDWVVYSLYQNNERPIFINNPNKLTVGLFHGIIEGMSTNLDYVFTEGYSKLHFRDLDLVLCGDIHKRQVTYNIREIEVDETDVDYYLNLGWEIPDDS